MSGLRPRDPVDRVSGVGPARAAQLARRGIETVEDLLLYLPFRYEDRSALSSVADLEPDAPCTLQVEVESCRVIRGRGRMARVEARVADSTGSLRVVWFHQTYVANTIGKGDRVWLYGRVTVHDDETQLVNPVLERIVSTDDGIDGAPVHVGRLVPIYRRIGPLGPAMLRRLIHGALEQLDPPQESIPCPTIERLGLVSRGEALREAHQPPEDADAESYNAGRSRAHERFICEEFLAFQTALQGQRPGQRGRPGMVFDVDDVEAVLAPLPFTLTNGQRRALREILDDMARAEPMHRLLQGDVGSGKTAIAGAAMMLVAQSGFQAALMAPTEILARQHAGSLAPWAQRLGLELVCLTGSQDTSERRRIREGLAAHALQLVVGTHALIEPGVEFAALGLAVVDEQHRFGVRQRAALRGKGVTEARWPDLLVMTATPIPRTLALTAYGDLDLCTIDELPPGRQPVTTTVVSASDWPKVLELIRTTVGHGEQVFVVAPRIEAGGDELAAAVRLEADLRRQLPGIEVGLLHGGQPPDDKMVTMQEFIGRKIDVLAATTVVEVGVDVANATLMVVGHAERFGLAQLHQLRGRVGRGEVASRCVFVAYEPLTPMAEARLEAIRETDDGFVLAERDLELRGPGEVLGTRQAGVAGLRVGDPIHDRDWLVATREEALRLAAADDEESVRYRERAEHFWQRRFVAAHAG